MDGYKTEDVDKTVLKTPKPTACSTIYKKSSQRKLSEQKSFEDSLGLIDVNESYNVSKDGISSLNSSDLSFQLKQQRQLANSSLQRANKITALPSRYLRPNTSSSSVSSLNITNESTISESDLTKSPLKYIKDTSTPRTSLTINNPAHTNVPRLSLGQSMAQLSYQIGNTDISIDDFVKEFQKVMNTDKASSQIDSKLFSPAEEAASMLLADEISWRKQNEIPLSDNFSQVSNQDMSFSKVSMGEFFQQKSDTLSDFKMALSPVKTKNPIPLIDSTVSFAEEQNNDNEASKKSLSITAIQKFLAETDDTPRKVTSFLLKKGQKSSENLVDQSSLPVSRNSSYTSNYSDNEAIRNLVANKENIDNSNITEKVQIGQEVKTRSSSELQNRPLSSGSTRSLSSALTSLPGGKLPIESTKTELVWGCVKLDKSDTQEFLLRNKSGKRLRIQISVTGHNFRIRKDNRQDSEALSSAKLLLHPHESRAVIVSFIPTKIGAAVDDLSFTSLDPNLQQVKKQSVRLYGYGGFGKVDILNLTKDLTGRYWLCLGKLDNQNIFTKKIVLKNSGNLPCFTCINFNPKERFAFTNVSITPNLCILIPNEQKEITLTFTLTLEDRQVLLNSIFSRSMVAETGNLLILSGTEVNRGRLRRQCRKYAENGLEIDSISRILKDKVKGEIMPSDLNLFKESTGSLKDFLKSFNYDEITVTIEQDPEVTIMPQYPDESAMFHTLCQDNTAACLETTNLQASCRLEPSNIILTPPVKIADSLFLISDHTKPLHFETVSNPKGLEVFPKDGIIAPGQEIVISISCSESHVKDKSVFKVLVYIENEVFEATVKIIFLYSKIQKN